MGVDGGKWWHTCSGSVALDAVSKITDFANKGALQRQQYQKPKSWPRRTSEGIAVIAVAALPVYLVMRY